MVIGGAGTRRLVRCDKSSPSMQPYTEKMRHRGSFFRKEGALHLSASLFVIPSNAKRACTPQQCPLKKDILVPRLARPLSVSHKPTVTLRFVATTDTLCIMQGTSWGSRRWQSQQARSEALRLLCGLDVAPKTPDARETL